MNIQELEAQIEVTRDALNATRETLYALYRDDPKWADLRAEEIRLYRELSRLTVALHKLKYVPDNGAGWPSSFEQAAWDRKRGKVA